MAVNLRQSEKLAFVEIDAPPVNALGIEVRRGLMGALAEIDACDDIDAVVLLGAGTIFSAGADIREFAAGPGSPRLPEVVTAIEQARLPWVAAINGSALGGGLELALGCSFRIASPDARLGLPEVGLGLIPGAGGTVRLTRLVGAETALDMISGGKPVSAEFALAVGLIDQIAASDLLESVVEWIGNQRPASSSRPALRREIPIIRDRRSFAEKLEILKTNGTNGQHSLAAAAAAVERAMTLPPEKALAEEREAFLKLRADPQSAALRYLFFAERSTARCPRLTDARPRPLRSVGVVGGGLMGTGIATACLMSGFVVKISEIDPGKSHVTLAQIDKNLGAARHRNLIDEQQLEEARSRIHLTNRLKELADTDIIIEAVHEDMETKQDVFRALSEIIRQDAVLATNSSYLDINQIAAVTKDPQHVIGLHFFAPAQKMKLLEIIAPTAADPAILATAFAFAKRLGKVPILAGVCDGFIANRVMSAYRRSCDRMVETGTAPWAIDRAMIEFGFPMGIFEMQDLSGLNIALARRQRLDELGQLGENRAPIADRLCQLGRLGRKSGRGWHRYDKGLPVRDPEVEEMARDHARKNGLSDTPLSSDQIIRRILEAMQSEGCDLLAEDIAWREQDIDVAMVNGFGFPRWRGGPMYMAGQSMESD